MSLVGQSRNCGSMPVGEKVFVCFQSVPHVAGFHPASFSIVTKGCLSGGKDFVTWSLLFTYIKRWVKKSMAFFLRSRISFIWEFCLYRSTWYSTLMHSFYVAMEWINEFPTCQCTYKYRCGQIVRKWTYYVMLPSLLIIITYITGTYTRYICMRQKMSVYFPQNIVKIKT
jgi:hypothetical protein